MKPDNERLNGIGLFLHCLVFNKGIHDAIKKLMNYIIDRPFGNQQKNRNLSL
jgi:hypothetical protein